MGLFKGIIGLIGIVSSLLAATSIFITKAGDKIAQYTTFGVVEFLTIGILALSIYVFLSDD